MILCLDVGNSHIFGGVFINDTLQFSFRYPSKDVSTSDVFGVFLRAVLRENQLEPTEVKQIALCSVVPSLDYSIRAACVKYFDIRPFELKAGVKTGLKIQFKNPLEVGADRIANAIAVTDLFPQQNIIVIDFGTATTFCAIAANKAYVGGVILPGLRISVEALNSNAAKLSPVPILKPAQAVGRTTAENIQSGLYYGQLGTIKELTTRIADEVFAGEKPLVIGTGGFAQLFEAEGIFSQVIPDLVLHGLRVALQQNVVVIPA